jgi:Domain of unknown function (DUF4328)
VDPYARYARWQPLTPLARFLIGLLGASAVLSALQVIGIVVAPTATSVTTRINLIGSAFQDQTTPGLGGAIGGVGSLIGIGAGVVWLIWQHRGQQNLYARRMPGLRYTPGWTVGWWFVPFANLALPYLCMRELFGAAGRSGGAPRRDGRLLAWWLLYVGSLLGLIGFIPIFAEVFRGIARAPGGDPSQVVVTISASAIRAARTWSAVGALARIAAAGFASWAVWTISTREDALGTGAAPTGPGGPRVDLPARPGPPPPRPDLSGEAEE